MEIHSNQPILYYGFHTCTCICILFSCLTWFSSLLNSLSSCCCCCYLFFFWGGGGKTLARKYLNSLNISYTCVRESDPTSEQSTNDYYWEEETKQKPQKHNKTKLTSSCSFLPKFAQILPGFFVLNNYACPGTLDGWLRLESLANVLLWL